MKTFITTRFCYFCMFNTALWCFWHLVHVADWETWMHLSYKLLSGQVWTTPSALLVNQKSEPRHNRPLLKGYFQLVINPQCLFIASCLAAVSKCNSEVYSCRAFGCLNFFLQILRFHLPVDLWINQEKRPELCSAMSWQKVLLVDNCSVYFIIK